MKISTFIILGFKLPFSVLFFIEQIVGKVLFHALQDWPIDLPMSIKIGSAGPSNLIWRRTILIRWKIFSKKLDDVVSNFDDFIIY